MSRIFLCTFFVLLFVHAADAAHVYPQVCIPANGSASFQFNSSAVNENSVKIVRISDNHVEAAFNNYFGNGAGPPEWTQRSGWVHLAPLGVTTCYRIEGRNKADRPNSGLLWRDSIFRIRPEGGGVDFEDGTDADFNDAIVDVQVRGPGAFSGARVCAPRRAVVWIEVNFFFPVQTLIRISRTSDNRTLRTFASNVPPGGMILAGGNQLFGAGTFATRPADGSCFNVTGSSRTGGTGAGVLRPAPQQSNADITKFDSNLDGQFGEAQATVRYVLDPIVTR